MERVKLLTRNENVYTVNGKYLFSVSMTDIAKELLNDEGWDKGNESWLSYRIRTSGDRLREERRRQEIASDLVGCYNDKFNLS